MIDSMQYIHDWILKLNIKKSLKIYLYKYIAECDFCTCVYPKQITLSLDKLDTKCNIHQSKC